MPSNIEILKAQLNGGGGPASPTRYYVRVNFPNGMAGAGFAGALFSSTVEISELPGRAIATTPQIIYGVARKMPYGVVYNDLPMTFICSNDMSIRSIFDEWHSLITDPTNNYFNYYDNYVGSIEIFKMDEDDNATYYQIVEEVYPLVVESQIIDGGAVDEYLRLTVIFAYRRWRTSTDLAYGGKAFQTDPTQPQIPYREPVFDGGGNLNLPPPINNRLLQKTPTGPNTFVA